ncbi:apolipoprotein acyltransferase [Sulfitobacter sp. S190]|uniref:apolipoprotein acyltransferase n=1 Tax=Sulfitobacter sp. S190 TaxID=2867022 RepID=UPI0021A4A287|nr:apolipoprotein acyltransferase [Sulfitobacter sp. S190]UWR20925.1 apolipoprotein acyltransferase [Sulfitobacter sp. S190]
MIVIGFAVIGAIYGGLTARKRKGNRKDVAQYAAGFGLAFMIVGMFLTVIIDRVAS